MQSQILFRFKFVTHTLIVMILFNLTPFLASRSEGSEKYPIYFFSSETNINNFVSLKKEFDGYLSKSGYFEFQPFKDSDTFERHVQKNKNCFMILSNWCYRKIGRQNAVRPIMVGIREGAKYQKRVLVSNEKNPGADYGKLEPVASSSNIEDTRSVLADILKNKHYASSIRILTVPKDVDALMSVGFEMAKAALVTEYSINNLKMIDPVLHSGLNLLGEGEKSLVLILAETGNNEKHNEKIVKIIKNMPDHIKRMLDLDGWQVIKPADISILEEK
ncbi:hypothetical protein QUF76_16295 [Desulfobacterales bacterium HSG16]|nr:hypothetical protein [Desulfobacterales bacterium HSG16]